MSLWNSITRRFRRTSATSEPRGRGNTRNHARWFRPTLLPLEDRAVPASDAFTTATLLTGVFAVDTGSNAGATAELGEPLHAGDPITNSVWWAWTAPTDGQVEVNTFGSAFDTVLAVYTGSAVDALTEVASNDDADGSQSQVVFDAVAGTTYSIAVDGFGADTGDILLRLGMAPANDDFANAISVTEETVTGHNMLATVEPGEPGGAGTSPPIHSVWWMWTATADGTAEVNTFGSDFDTVLAVYTGSAVDSLTLVGANDDADGGVQSQVLFQAVAGTTYSFAVDGFLDQTGRVVVNVPGSASGSNNPPAIDPQSFGVDENSFGATVVGTVAASDPDAGQTLTYAIIGGNTGGAFSIGHTSGEIKVLNAAALDYETNPAFSLVVAVTDDGSPNLSTSATVTVNLNDLNEVPAFAGTGPFDVNEHSPAGTPVGTVAATDPDAGQRLAYSIVGGNDLGGFAIDSATGAITVANGAVLDHLATPSITLTVRAADDGTPSLSADADVIVAVDDVNESPVIGDQAFAVNENSAAGTVVGLVTASDPDTGQVLTYAITGGNTSGAFAINSASGQITVANSAALDHEATPSFTLAVQVTDNGSPVLSSSATVTISVADVNEAPVLDNTGNMSLANVTQGAANPGTRVSDLLASAGGSRITDPDVGAVQGIAVFAADTANGSWQFSADGGNTWAGLGAVSTGSARLLASDSLTRIRFVPNASFAGTVVQGIAFRAWDQTSGTNGGLGDVSSGGGSSAFSLASETASVTVTSNSGARLICLLAAQVKLFASWGLLSNGASTSLQSDLSTATRKLNEGDVRHAVEALRTFVSKVNSPLCSTLGTIPRAVLTLSANTIIAVLLT